MIFVKIDKMWLSLFASYISVINFYYIKLKDIPGLEVYLWCGILIYFNLCDVWGMLVYIWFKTAI